MFNCVICENKFETMIKLVSHVRHEHKLKVKEYYDKYLKKDGDGYCLTCNKELKFKNITNGYGKFCSKRCISKSNYIKNKKKKSFKEKYGVENPSQLEGIKQKKKETTLKNYGVEYGTQSEEVKEKFRNTNLKKYGVENPNQSHKIKEKVKKSNLEKYGVEYYTQTDEYKNKVKQTNLEKYGVENPNQSSIVKDKIKNTNLKNYGAKYYTQTDEYKNKVKQTNLEKYGTEYACQSDEVKEKIKKSNLEKYNVEYPQQNKEIRNKSKKTNLEKYGVEYIGQSEEIKDRIKNINLEKYGVEYYTQTDEYKNKVKQTNLEKYGTEYYSQSDQYKEKVKNTNLEKYGVENPTQNKEIKDRIKKTNLEKYGTEYACQSDEVKDKIFDAKNKKFLSKLHMVLDYFEVELLEDYKGAHIEHKFKCKKCNSEFKRIWNYVQQGNIGCPECNKQYSTISRSEIEVSDFLKSLGIDNIIENSRNIIKPYELDIYLPDYNLAIEFNGLYWHSVGKGVDSFYHLNKTNLCKEKGIRLIHIFEDEWMFKKDIIKERLKSILNLNNDKIRIHARNCDIREITAKDKNKFLEEYHLQGKDSSSIKLGAFYNDELVSVMTFSHGNISKGSKSKKNIWELNRFSSNYNYHIPGIASKLLTYFKRNYEWEQIYSYADKRLSEGNLYFKLDFDYLYDTKPNYWYVKNSLRIHRFSLRKRKDEPKDIPEWLLRLNEGYDRIWDCGNMKFSINNQPF